MIMLKILVGILESLRKKQVNWLGWGDLDNVYKFNFRDTKIMLFSSIPIRNYETILRNRDMIDSCGCGKKLKTKQVRFSITGSGRVKYLPVQYCPECDNDPLESAILFCTINDQPFFCGV